MKNRIASVLTKLYGDPLQPTAETVTPRALVDYPAVPPRLKRVVARELKRIGAIAAAEPFINVKVVGVATKHAEPATVFLQVRVMRSGRKSRVLDRLKVALASDPLLRNVRLVLFKRRPKPKRL